MTDDRPAIRCLVGFLCPSFGLVGQPRVMTLEEAADYARFGFVVMVDPADLSDLARWEQIQRSLVQAERGRWWQE